ncbi:protein D1-like [Argiope bruennichi]|uniref:protein D1-like n=1 Tax=Argiope bruennichi TaxID=94029 RepID=UPI002494F53D|nr:protein D1-like [Argiope bruennichi]
MADKLKYDKKAVTCGNELTRAETKQHPTVVDFSADMKKLYTFIMIDPDAPTPQNPNLAIYRHWMFENVPGNIIQNGDLVTSYDAPQAPTFSVCFSRISAIEVDCDLNKFRTSNIVPKIIPTLPHSPLLVKFNNRAVACGNEFTRAETKLHPTVVDFDADIKKLYTFIMIDPDTTTPQYPDLANYLHWLIENVPGNVVLNGDSVTSYDPPQAPTFSDTHRYIFLVYEQRGKLKDDFEGRKRTNFNLKKFVQDRGLKGPVAGNFFYLKD